MDQAVAMRQRLFAVKEYRGSGAQHHIKIASIREVLDANGFIIHRIDAYNPGEDDTFELPITCAQETTPCPKTICLGQQTIRMWRTPWTVNHRGTWIPILDSDNLDAIPGDFMYMTIPTTEERCRQRNSEQRKLLMAIVSGTYEEPLESTTARAPSHPIKPNPAKVFSTTPPRFVATIMKRDAVATNYECPITMEPFTADTSAAVTPCFHLFGKDAIHRWIQAHHSCPVCKCSVTEVLDI